MTDLPLSHWGFAADFTGAEAVALIFGIDRNLPPGDPSQISTLNAAEAKFTPAIARMKKCYDSARACHMNFMRSPTALDVGWPNDALESVEMSELYRRLDPDNDSNFVNWLGDEYYSGFDTQRFSRREIALWLVAIGQKSAYSFDPELTSGQVQVDIGADLDPLDLPFELDCAMQAFRAVSNGHGNKTATFKNRLRAYLEETYQSLTPEAMKRIAILANPDKTPGRQKSPTE